MVHLTSPQLLSKRYIPWRLLRAPGMWASFYAARARQLKGFKSALVFPEQLLAISGATIYCVGSAQPTTLATDVYTTVTLHKVTNARLFVSGFKGTLSIADIYAEEDASQNPLNITNFRLRVNSSNSEECFFNHWLFSSRDDAVKYAKQIIAKIT